MKGYHRNQLPYSPQRPTTNNNNNNIIHTSESPQPPHKQSPGIIKILCSAFFFSVIISLIASIGFGVYYLVCRFSLYVLGIAFGIFYVLWLIGYFCVHIYETYITDQTICCTRRGRGDHGIGNHDREPHQTRSRCVINGPSFPPETSFQAGTLSTSEFGDNNQPISEVGEDEEVENCRSRIFYETKLTKPPHPQYAESQKNPKSSTYPFTGAFKLIGMCPPFPGSDRACGPPDCSTTYPYQSQCRGLDSTTMMNPVPIGSRSQPTFVPCSESDEIESQNYDMELPGRSIKNSKLWGRGEQNEEDIDPSGAKNNNDNPPGLIPKIYNFLRSD